MNSVPILNEVRHEMARTEPREHNYVISFTLMPITPTDMELLEHALGTGPIVAESKGYGTCRVQLTGRRNVWSVQHMNAMGTVILDTIEIGDVPIALLAGEEDFEDSAERIRELLEDDL
jgi:hydrogenase-1 operon protein HyaF